MPKDCNDFAVLTSAQRYRQCLAMRMVQMFKKTLFFFSKLLFLQQKITSNPPELIRIVLFQLTLVRAPHYFRPWSQVENLWTASSFFIAFTLCTFTKLDLNVGVAWVWHGSVGGRYGPPQCDKDWGIYNFQKFVMEKSTNEKRQIRMSCVLYCFIFFSLFSKAHSTCGVSLLDYLHLTLCPMILVAKNSCCSDCSEIYFKIQLGSEEQRTPVGNLGGFGTFGILLELKYLKSHVGQQTFSGRLSKAGTKEQPVTSCAKINQIYTVPCCKAFDYLLNMCWY